MRKIVVLSLGLLILFSVTLAQAQTIFSFPRPAPDQNQNTRDRFATETSYTFSGDFDDSRLGDGTSLYSDFSYDHRFLIQDKWYFRAGIEYERYDFGGTNNGLPDHLQASYAHLAIEYVVDDFPAVSLELDPGFYFQSNISGDSFDVPCKAYATFPLKKGKIFGLIGVGAGIYQHPTVAPGGGIIWIFNDKLRLQGVFPKPAMIYEPNDDWEFEVFGNLVYESFRTDDVFTPLHKLRVHNAVVQYNEDRGGFQVRYSGFKPFNISARAGYTFLRAFDFFRHGVREKVDPAPFVSLSIDARF